MDEGLGASMRERLMGAFCAPWSTSEGVTDWRGLSLGTAESSEAAMLDAPMDAPMLRSEILGGSPSQRVPSMTPSSQTAVPGLTDEEHQMLNELQGQFSNLRVRRLIDEGASSQVWEGDWAGARVVIKVLREQEALRSFLGEVNIWRQLRHPCVCSLFGVCMFEQRPSMVLEYMIGTPCRRRPRAAPPRDHHPRRAACGSSRREASHAASPSPSGGYTRRLPGRPCPAALPPSLWPRLTRRKPTARRSQADRCTTCCITRSHTTVRSRVAAEGHLRRRRSTSS